MPAPPFAMLFEIVLPVTVSAPELPMPQVGIVRDGAIDDRQRTGIWSIPAALSASETVRPEIVAVTPESTVNTPTDPPPLTSRSAAPGPAIVRFCEISIAAESVIVEHGGDNTNVMVSLGSRVLRLRRKGAGASRHFAVQQFVTQYRDRGRSYVGR